MEDVDRRGASPSRLYPGSVAGDDTGRRPEDAPREPERGPPDELRRRGRRPVRHGAPGPDALLLVRGDRPRPLGLRAEARGLDRVEGVRRPRLGRRRLGPLLHEDARPDAGRAEAAEALRLGERHGRPRDLEGGRLQPGAAPLDGDLDGAPDRPRLGPPDDPDRGRPPPVVPAREEHDRREVGAPPRRDARQQEHLGQDLARRTRRRSARPPPRRARASAPRPGPRRRGTSRRCRSGA